MTNEVLTQLLDLERLGWESLATGSGADFYGEIMTDDGLMVLAGGMVFGRDAVVASLRGAPEWDRYELENARLVPHSPDVVTLVYRATAHRDAQPEPFIADMTSTYVRDDSAADGWRLGLYTQTPVG